MLHTICIMLIRQGKATEGVRYAVLRPTKPFETSQDQTQSGDLAESIRRTQHHILHKLVYVGADSILTQGPTLN